MCLGEWHFRHILHCLRSKAAKDLKANDNHAAQALRRLRLGKECERIVEMLHKTRGQIEAHEVACALGWEPPPVLFGDLNSHAQQWLDTRFRE